MNILQVGPVPVVTHHAMGHNVALQKASSPLLFGKNPKFEDFQREFPTMSTQKQVEGLLQLWDKNDHDLRGFLKSISMC